jgi:hypothetical protein
MLKLISSIGLALTLAEIKQRARRLVTQGILSAIGLAFLLIGVCFLLVAGHLYLSKLLNPIASAAIIGGALLFVALIFFLVASAKGRAAPRPAAAAPRASVDESMSRVGDALGGTSLASPALMIAGLALLLGFLFGRRSGKSDDD